MKGRRKRNDCHFQTRSPQQLSWHDRLCAHRLYAGGNGHLFCCPESGLRPDGFWLLHALPHHICAAFVYPGAHHALLCRGTPHPHRSAAAYQPGVCVGDRAGQILCPVRHLCTAVPCRCGHDPCTGRTGCHRHSHAGKLGRSAVLLSHGLRRHCHWRVSFQPDRESDHCCGGRCCRTAAGLHDAQPAQHVHRRQRSGAGPVHRHCGSAQCGGRPAYPRLYAGLPDLCGLLCGADGTVPAAEQLADRSVQRGAQRAVPVHAV